MPAKKGTKQRINWGALKKRFLNHEWHTLDEMGEKLKISRGTWDKHSQTWRKERAELEQESEVIAKEQIIESNAQILQRMLQRQIQIADALQIKAANRLMGKVQAVDAKGALRFDKKGRPILVERKFDDDQLSMMALRFTGGVLGQLMRRRPGDDDSGAGGMGSGMADAIFDLNAPDMEAGKAKNKITQWTPDQLRLMIGDKNASNTGTKKGRG